MGPLKTGSRLYETPRSRYQEDRTVMVKQTQRSKTRRFRRLIRLLSALVLALFCSQSALAYALPFVAQDDCGDECPGGEDEESCPCPFNCLSRCAGSTPRAIPPAPPIVAPRSATSVEILPLWVERAPPTADPAEILHVPKARRA